MAYMGSLNTGGGVLPITTTLYGTCDTAAATAAKVVTCSDFDTIADGFRIAVLFTLGNTATSSVTININNKGDITLNNPRNIDANELVDIIYINSKFHIFYEAIPKKLSQLTDDVVDGNYVKLNSTSAQMITTNSDTPFILNRNIANSNVFLCFRNANSILGYYGVDNSSKPTYIGGNDDVAKEIALSNETIKRLPGWLNQDTHNVDDAEPGVRFVYTSHGAPTTGTLITLAGSNFDNYRLQLISPYPNYGNNSLYMRNKNGDTSTWGNWLEILSSNRVTKFAVVSGSQADYRKLVVGLCKIGTEKGSWCSAKLIFHRFNGLRPPNVLALSICGNYYNNTQCNATIEYSNLTKQSQSPDGGSYPGYAIVTFKHNNEWYAGIEYCYQASADFIYAEYSGSIDPFAFAWYRTDTSTILDQEYADSVTYDAYNQLQACHAGI